MLFCIRFVERIVGRVTDRQLQALRPNGKTRAELLVDGGLGLRALAWGIIWCWWFLGPETEGSWSRIGGVYAENFGGGC